MIACATARSGADARASGSGTCNNNSWLAAYRDSAAMASTAASGLV
jgi:hypothetical protein